VNYVYLLLRKPWRKYHLARNWRIVKRANQLEESFTRSSDAELAQSINDLELRCQAVKKIDRLVPTALAIGRETSRRQLGMRHYDVQLVGTLTLWQGHIAEMDTGEGKTLMAPLAAFLHKLAHAGHSTHIVTANEYLAARDAQWMGPLYKGLGMTVGLIVPAQSPTERAQAYQNDVVYATAKEIVFDSLRDPLQRKRENPAHAILRPQVQSQLEQKFDFAIVDEVDSVLIDQAQSPLSLGQASSISPQLELYKQANKIAGQLLRGQHYRLMQDDRKVELKEEGKAEARRHAGSALRLLPTGHKWERYITCALAARYIYKRDQHYVVRGGKIILIDESTGRLLPGRQLPDGIHQALEVNSGIVPTAELRGNLMTTFQTYFRKYQKLAGMTGTAAAAAGEFLTVYNLAVLPIPPNKPSRRMLLPDQVYRGLKYKYQAVIENICRIHATGRPLLVATGSVKISEEISQLLEQRNLPHEVLNAKNHAREAEIIAQAGREGRITVITNMAGRGVDIVLGEGIAQKGGMFLISTDRLYYRRLDEQLSGRIGRQGDPGQCQFFLSLNDDLIRYANRKKVCRLRMKTRSRRCDPIELPDAAKLFEKVQKHIRKFSSKQRQRIFQGEKQREKLKEQGLWEDWMDAR